MNLNKYRKLLLERIRITEKNVREFPENERLKGMLEAYIDAFNLSFDFSDKRRKWWKCKICGRLKSGVIKPYCDWFKPYDHECEFVVVKRGFAIATFFVAIAKVYFVFLSLSK